MHTTTRIAVFGLYNSGSTALAGALHRLGVDMGAPFWCNSDDHSPRNFYEPWDLGCLLREWWNEPTIRERTDRATRVACLAQWIRLRQGLHQGVAGAKHPLLSLCGEELVEAWGSSTRFLRAWRPLGESIARLQARRWFSPCEDRLQRTLWEAVEHFCARQPHWRVDFHRLKQEPAAVLGEVVAYAQLTPTPAQMAAAVAFIDRTGGREGRASPAAEEGKEQANSPPDRRAAIYHDLHHHAMRQRDEAIRRSAELILAALFRHFSPRSVLDVGCGLGTWLQAARTLGVADIRGIEGDWLDQSLLRVPPQHILTLDLEQSFDLGRRFDLVICLEVVEYLRPAAAATLVESLVRHADVILFSAAIPFQGGHHHVHEQFPDYWEQLFGRFNYRAVDFLRPILWSNPAVLWWLRQNVLVFARRERTVGEGPFADLPARAGPLALVHPDFYLQKVQEARAVQEEYDKLLALLRSGSTFAVVHHPDGRLTITRTS